MEITTANGKYNGRSVFNYYIDDKEVKEINIIETNPIYDKYLVLVNQKEFLVSGIDKIYDLKILCETEKPERIRNQINKAIERIYNQCYAKKLKRLDVQRFKQKVSKYYDDNYHMFIFIGMKLPDLFSKLQKELAF